MAKAGTLTLKEIMAGIENVIGGDDKYQEIKKVLLFGSYALDEANEKSNINLCISEPESYQKAKLIELRQALEKYYNKEVHLLAIDSIYVKNKQLYQLIRTSGVVVFEK